MLGDVGGMGLQLYIPASQTLDYTTGSAAHADETNGLAAHHARLQPRRARLWSTYHLTAGIFKKRCELISQTISCDKDHSPVLHYQLLS
jgi:hypothetical protein